MIIGENEMLRHTYYVKIFIYIVGESIITSFWFGLLKNVTNKIYLGLVFQNDTVYTLLHEVCCTAPSNSKKQIILKTFGTIPIVFKH